MIKTKISLFLIVCSALAWVSWFRYGNLMPGWLSGTFAIWNFLVGPIVVIVTARMAKEELDYENPKGPVWLLARIVIGTPLGFFGFLFILTTLSFGGFAIWRAFVVRDFDLVDFAALAGTLLAGLGFGWLMLRGAFRREGATREEIESSIREWEEHITNPDWTFYREHLGREIPPALLPVYGTRKEFIIPLPGDEFLEANWSPVHPSQLLSREETRLPYDIVPLAWSDETDPIFLMPGADEKDAVYLGEHGNLERIVPLCDDVERWIEQLDLV